MVTQIYFIIFSLIPLRISLNLINWIVGGHGGYNCKAGNKVPSHVPKPIRK